MTSHEKIRSMLTAMAGNDLSPGDRSVVEQHLSDCQSCRIELDRLQTLLKALRATPEVDPPSWLATRILARVKEEDMRKGLIAKLFLPLHLKLPLEGLALVFVGVVAWYLIQGAERSIEMPQVMPPGSLPPVSGELKDSGKSAADAAKKGQSDSDNKGGAFESAKPKAESQLREEKPELASPPTSAAPPAFVPPPRLATDRAVESSKTAPEQALPAPASREQAAGAAAPSMEKKAAARYKSETVDNTAARPQLRVRMLVEDRAVAGEQLRRIAHRLGGSAEIRTDGAMVRVEATRLNELFSQIAALGRVIDRPAGELSREGWVELKIFW